MWTGDHESCEGHLASRYARLGEIYFSIVSFLNILNIITIFVMLLFAFPLLQSQSSGSIKFQGRLGAEGIRE